MEGIRPDLTINAPSVLAAADSTFRCGHPGQEHAPAARHVEAAQGRVSRGAAIGSVPGVRYRSKFRRGGRKTWWRDLTLTGRRLCIATN
jgi:hypothetical protein